MQVLSADGRRLAFGQLARELLRNEGPRALWSGLGARVLTIGPGAALSWMLYGELKAILAQHC